MSLLDPILSATAVPHQPFVVIAHGVATSPTPVLQALLARAPGRIALVSFLRPPARYRPPTRAELLDLSGVVRGYRSEAGSGSERVEAQVERIAAGGGTVVLDAVDLLAEDVGVPATMRLIARLIPTKAPARLVLVAARDSALLPHLVPVSLSPSLALLTPHQPAHVAHLAREYLLAPADARFWDALDAAAARGDTDALAFGGAAGGVGPEPASVASRPTRAPPGPPVAVQVLVRRPAGGAKGMARSLEALVPTPAGFDVGPIDSVARVDLGAAAGQGRTHAELGLPFNLGLTERQREERRGVAVPYAHEGEGADLGMGMDWEEDEEDDEI